MFCKDVDLRGWTRFDGIGQKQWRAAVNYLNEPPILVRCKIFLNPQLPSFKRSYCTELVISDFNFYEVVSIIIHCSIFVSHMTVQFELSTSGKVWCIFPNMYSANATGSDVISQNYKILHVIS